MAAVSQELTYQAVATTVSLDGLSIMGGVHEDANTILLLGPSRGFWPLFKTSDEMLDGLPDPFDRWSTRIVTRIAGGLGATALFPFGGPPYAPFLRWALASGRAWSSPVGMLVHDQAGLMVSFRGALKFARHIALPAPPPHAPCDTCTDMPCLGACPVGALSRDAGYNVDACHTYLDTSAGQDCMANGCIARRACPVSQSFGRDPAQSAIHMQYFHRS